MQNVRHLFYTDLNLDRKFYTKYWVFKNSLNWFVTCLINFSLSLSKGKILQSHVLL